MKYIYIIFICFIVSNTKALNSFIQKETLINDGFSSELLFKNDSLLKLKFDKISKLKSKDKFVEALTQCLALLEESKKNKNHFWAYKFTFLIAEIYKRTNKLEKSLKMHQEALDLISSISKEDNTKTYISLDLAKSLMRVGTSFHNLYESIEITKNDSYSDSIKLSNKSKLYLEKTKFYYNKIENFPNLNIEVENLKATAFNNISTIYERDSNYVMAKEYIDKAITIHKKNNNNLSTAKSLNNLGNIYLSQKKYQKSKDIYLDALKLIKNDKGSIATRTKANLYFNLAWAMRNLKEFKAYDYQEKSYEIQDAMRDKEFRVIVEELAQKYDFDSKKEILLEKEENKRLKQQRAFWFLGVIALLIIISLVYLINLHKLKQKNLALKLSKTELLKKQEIEKIKSESQAIILNATIDGKESERKQIAETLHDSVSALLSSANMHLQATKKQFNGNTPVEIKKTQQIIEEASHKVRGLSHNLVSSVLLKFGLNFAIRDLAEKFSNSELVIDTEINEIRRYSQNFEIKVHNIILELVNNIIKHSKANNALIQLKEVDKIIFITISDDGVGFDKTKINTKDGLGINQIDARIQMMKGKFHIKSSKNNGTTISVEIPVLEIEELNLV